MWPGFQGDYVEVPSLSLATNTDLLSLFFVPRNQEQLSELVMKIKKITNAERCSLVNRFTLSVP